MRFCVCVCVCVCLQERMNVWVALLNLEAVHGTIESTQQLFARARENCDAELISLKMIDIYEKHSFAQQAEDMLTTLLRRFSDSTRVWTVAIKRKLASGDHDAANKLLQRALKALGKKNRE